MRQSARRVPGFRERNTAAPLGIRRPGGLRRNWRRTASCLQETARPDPFARDGVSGGRGLRARTLRRKYFCADFVPEACFWCFDDLSDFLELISCEI